MRHQKKGFKLGRTSSHRKATLSAMAAALIKHKRITTTLTKARALRMYAEPIINRAKQDTTHNRRQVFRHLNDKVAVTELFSEISGRISDRPGGYTRIVKLGQRAGDSAEMAIIELVDYNDVKPGGASAGKKRRTRRAGRRGSGPAQEAPAAEVEVVDETPEEVVADVDAEEAPAAEVEAEEAPAAEAEVAEEAPAAEAEVAEEAPAAEAEDSSPDEEKKGD
jgi:large subunit ribosomal protein L17